MLGISKDNSPDRCCLCGSADELTGEHKVKASVIRSIFSGDEMAIGSFGDRASPLRRAQGRRSKALHFRARLCGRCNSTRTQPADLEFDRFDAAARRLLDAGSDPGETFSDPRYAIGTPAYLAVFRYFAKALACQIADAGGPRVLHLTRFALGGSDVNPVRLAFGTDPWFKTWFEATRDPQFAGHGGLGTTFSRRTGLMNGMQSTLTHGPLCYRFSIGFGPAIALALRLSHPTFYGRCRVAYREELRRLSEADGEVAAQ